MIELDKNVPLNVNNYVMEKPFFNIGKKLTSNGGNEISLTMGRGPSAELRALNQPFLGALNS